MAKTLPARDQVAPEDTWDLSKMYADRESWEEDLKQAREMGKKLADQEGHVCESARSLLDTLRQQTALYRKLHHLGVMYPASAIRIQATTPIRR